MFCLVELNDKTYRLFKFNGETAASIQIKIKTGWRTLGGHGRANRAKEWVAVIAKARDDCRAETHNS